MSALDNLATAISDALDEAPAADVLTVITGVFVGLTVEMVRRAGHDVSKPITVDGGEQRDITIHPPKSAPRGAERNPLDGQRKRKPTLGTGIPTCGGAVE